MVSTLFDFVIDESTSAWLVMHSFKRRFSFAVSQYQCKQNTDLKRKKQSISDSNSSGKVLNQWIKTIFLLNQMKISLQIHPFQFATFVLWNIKVVAIAIKTFIDCWKSNEFKQNDFFPLNQISLKCSSLISLALLWRRSSLFHFTHRFFTLYQLFKTLLSYIM